ncbi:sodium/nucleoside cotransporter 2 isoform X5 [Tyto alba]|uniref:sodium/nucleoside cotransporter 2 isoform X5 n=1 Tax=Tyto alba TaxID=56313 RepID=UPI001C6632BF|nr:sodium/nucleoside cotransporter 2 isoform X5 [Tyto alba]
MEENQITLDNLEKGADNPAFSSVGEERIYEECDSPCGESKEERGRGWKRRLSSYCSLPVLLYCGLLAELPASPCLGCHDCCGCLLHLLEPLQEALWGKGTAAPQPRLEMLPKVLAVAEMFFLGYTTAGSSFVFGNTLIEEVFAFQTLPIVVFFSCVMSILYYLGVMQWLIVKISWLLQVSMGTTPAETLSVAGNIFVGQTEAPLLVRPYLADMTRSEIHAVMTGGFSTIAGSVMGAYISFGIDAASLIAASVMAAPCALAMSKLVYPEVEESKFKGKASIHLSSGEERNILEAASNGAAASVGLVANIAANLIAFLAVLEFINAALRWSGEMVDIEGLSFQVICSYILMPVAFLMGANWADSPLVAELLGIKIFLNEFVAYQQLATYKKNRLSGLEEWDGSRKQWISERSESIATFALCGFANLSSIGIMLGGLASMVPERKGDLASIVLRALLTGICVSMLNACLAGLLHVPTEVGDCVTFLSTANFSSTSYTTYVCCKQLFASSVLENGTLSFTGAWAGLAESVLCLTQCCRHYNHTSCVGTT